MNDQPLTDRQREVLNWIAKFIEDEGYPPTVREIGKGVGCTSPNAVAYQLSVLTQKGFIARQPSKARSIRVLVLPTS